jgi:ATP-binding cassette, subfamily C (CFTR/MRP), member 1
VFFSISAGFQDDQSLGVSKAFTSLAILQVLGTSFSALFTASLHLMTAVGCFGRIQDFLLSESRSDYRLLKSELELHGGGDPDDMSRDGSIMLLTLAAHNFAPDKSSQMAAVVTNGSFGWATDQVPQVMDVNISIPASRLTMIVGPVGCGKSTLLHGLLGETPNVTGVVMVASKEIAFCDQTSWLVNGTIQENILGVENFDLDWYNKVLHCCALDQDLSTMTLGDATVVGSKGIMLSGGQKQRIVIAIFDFYGHGKANNRMQGLARAVYSRKKIMILDDVLSGLDAITENKVFDRLLAPKGLCWQLQTTVILVTHAG